jgi:hypothetical protein
VPLLDQSSFQESTKNSSTQGHLAVTNITTASIASIKQLAWMVPSFIADFVTISTPKAAATSFTTLKAAFITILAAIEA